MKPNSLKIGDIVDIVYINRAEHSRTYNKTYKGIGIVIELIPGSAYVRILMSESTHTIGNEYSISLTFLTKLNKDEHEIKI